MSDQEEQRDRDAGDPRLHVVLVEPEIPPNTGNIGRLCLAAGARLHLVGALGFSLDDKQLRRAGMDYWNRVDLRRWESLDQLRGNASPGARFWLFTTKSDRPYWGARLETGDYLVFGPETRGLPEDLLASERESCVTVPMVDGERSLNLATCAGIGVYEALRQIALRTGR